MGQKNNENSIILRKMKKKINKKKQRLDVYKQTCDLLTLESYRTFAFVGSGS